MPFDGIRYGTQRLIAPYYPHPQAPALPDVPGDATRLAYMMCRENARLCGMQTFRHFLNGGYNSYEVESASFSHTTYVDIAQFVAYVPAWATHVFVAAHFSPLASNAIETLHRVAVTDGTNTDTGDPVIAPSDPRAAAQPSTGQRSTVAFAPGSGLSEAYCGVELSTVTQGQDLTITAQAYSRIDAGVSGSHRYQPHFVVAWWEAIG